MSVISLQRSENEPAAPFADTRSAAARVARTSPPDVVIAKDDRLKDDRAERQRTREQQIANALANAHAAGITALWTADHAASVELSRLAGPRDCTLTDGEIARFGLRGLHTRRLADGRCRCAVYERVLVSGTQFDIYRWINLVDLALAWPFLHLPRGIRYEWQRALQATGLYSAGADHRCGSPHGRARR